jgi:hypothetical protein
MGLFKKKADPITERALELNRQIAQLEEQIEQLSKEKKVQPPRDTPAKPSAIPAPSANPQNANLSAQTEAASKPGPSAPRLRSTALPHGPTVAASKSGPGPFPDSGSPAQDPIFEDVGQNPFRSSSAPVARETGEPLGIRRDDFSSFWQRFKAHFRGPMTSNPKLVNYLAAGSIQGLRPLRYERRVARNRFIVLVVVLALILWGILALLLKR